MWIQVRSFDGQKSIRVDGLSKLTKIEELRSKLVDPFSAPQDRQRLFYRGKQLENGQTLFDYSVGLNDIIQIMIKAEYIPEQPKVDSGFVSETSDSEHSTCTSGGSEVVLDTDDQPSTSKQGLADGTYRVRIMFCTCICSIYRVLH